jgi:hypothetical protein
MERDHVRDCDIEGRIIIEIDLKVDCEEMN